jgi:hypothetical protein
MDTPLKVQFYPMWCGQCILLPGFGLFGSFVSQSARWISWRLFGDSVYRSIASAKTERDPILLPSSCFGFGLKIDVDRIQGTLTGQTLDSDGHASAILHARRPTLPPPRLELPFIGKVMYQDIG